MKTKEHLALVHCPVHGYISFVSAKVRSENEPYCEQDLIDSPWIQRLRQIHQLQTAWWVFPSAEHTRFQHVLGVMFLASRATAAYYDSLKEVCGENTPSRGYVECLLRIAALLHDVGHGPFGHFFDEHFLQKFHLTHEILGAEIIRRELGDIIRGIRQNPNSRLEDYETLDPEQAAFLIVRPKSDPREELRFPKWLKLLRTLFCGMYTIDNMDFVLRDAYMSGYSTRAVDVERLFYYSFFTSEGLTIDERGLAALVQFLSVRGELFHTIYFHRTVRAVDLALEDIFPESTPYFISGNGNPLEHLAEYRNLTEWSLLMHATQDWAQSEDPKKKNLSARWNQILNRRIPWRTAAERTIFHDTRREEQLSIFSDRDLFGMKFRQALPEEYRDLPLRFDLARHTYRPGTSGPAAAQNFVLETKTGRVRPITDEEIVRRLPFISCICRVYAQDAKNDRILNQTMDSLLRESSLDDATNI